MLANLDSVMDLDNKEHRQNSGFLETIAQPQLGSINHSELYLLILTNQNN